jgi:hypothetical protein
VNANTNVRPKKPRLNQYTCRIIDLGITDLRSRTNAPHGNAGAGLQLICSLAVRRVLPSDNLPKDFQILDSLLQLRNLRCQLLERRRGDHCRPRMINFVRHGCVRRCNAFIRWQLPCPSWGSSRWASSMCFQRRPTTIRSPGNARKASFSRMPAGGPGESLSLSWQPVNNRSPATIKRFATVRQMNPG